VQIFEGGGKGFGNCRLQGIAHAGFDARSFTQEEWRSPPG